MGYKRVSPQPVVEGGTGAITMTTAYAPVCAGTTATGALQVASTGLGTSGFVLTSNGSSALPSFKASGSTITLTGNSGGGLTGSSFTITGGTSGGAFAGAGTTLTLSFTSLTFAGTTILRAPGTQNTLVGYSAGAVVTGSYNTSLGYQSLLLEASGSQNTAVGVGALGGQNGASNNCAFGYSAGSGITSGQYNIAIGYQTMGSASKTANENIIAGYQGCYAMTSGQRNLALGSNVLTSITSGSYNLALGWSAGQSSTTSDSSNIYLNNLGTGGESNVLRIGSATGTGNQQINKSIICGINGITVTGTAVLVSSGDQLGIAVSSARFKENIADMNDYSSPILKLRPATFNYTVGEDHSLQGGLIAEEVAEVMPSLVVYDKEGLPQTVKYHDMPALLLNELQKALKRIEVLEKKLK